MTENGPVYEKSFKFALSIVALYKKLVKQKEFVISKQLLRSGTSVGANIREASAAESKKDFIHKMSISSKEARESLYWLELLRESKMVDLQFQDEIKQSKELVRLLTSIVKTAKLNTKN
ncbi:MAG: four helix bundle protein [Balneolaceae bacterium]|nr:four helix bundle protein [Balneolaceae bacterium]